MPEPTENVEQTVPVRLEEEIRKEQIEVDDSQRR
jgi:hypothetical protein